MQKGYTIEIHYKNLNAIIADKETTRGIHAYIDLMADRCGVKRSRFYKNKNSSLPSKTSLYFEGTGEVILFLNRYKKHESMGLDYILEIKDPNLLLSKSVNELKQFKYTFGTIH